MKAFASIRRSQNTFSHSLLYTPLGFNARIYSTPAFHMPEVRHKVKSFVIPYLWSAWGSIALQNEARRGPPGGTLVHTSQFPPAVNRVSVPLRKHSSSFKSPVLPLSLFGLTLTLMICVCSALDLPVLQM